MPAPRVSLRPAPCRLRHDHGHACDKGCATAGSVSDAARRLPTAQFAARQSLILPEAALVPERALPSGEVKHLRVTEAQLARIRMTRHRRLADRDASRAVAAREQRVHQKPEKLRAALLAEDAAATRRRGPTKPAKSKEGAAPRTAR